MGRHAVPKYFNARDIDPSGRYNCPLCKVQTTADPVDPGWVYCPMLDNAAICLGCCIDHQKVARSGEFEGHPFRDLFDIISRLTKHTVPIARRICLEHQEAIIREEIRYSGPSKENLQLLSEIESAKTE